MSAPVYREDLNHLIMDEEKELKLHPICHTKAPFDLAYDAESGHLHLLCSECGSQALVLAIGSKPVIN